MDVSALAKGYLSLINANNRGQGISQAADYLAPVVEVGAMLGLSQRRQFSVPLNAPGAGILLVALFTVPANESWLMRAGGITFQSTTSSAIGIGLTMFVHTGAATSQGCPASESFDAQTGTIRNIPWGFPGLILESGTTVSLQAVMTGATCQYFGTFIYDRLTG